MASTRNINTQGNYDLELQNRMVAQEHKINALGRPVNESNPTHMMNYGSMSRDALSSNAIAIETQLFGIGSTNLVSAKAPVIPYLNKLPEKSFCERSRLIEPKSYTVSNTERPLMR